jgi:hypothetical protein
MNYIATVHRQQCSAPPHALNSVRSITEFTAMSMQQDQMISCRGLWPGHEYDLIPRISQLWTASSTSQPVTSFSSSQQPASSSRGLLHLDDLCMGGNPSNPCQIPTNGAVETMDGTDPAVADSSEARFGTLGPIPCKSAPNWEMVLTHPGQYMDGDCSGAGNQDNDTLQRRSLDYLSCARRTYILARFLCSCSSVCTMSIK